MCSLSATNKIFNFILNSCEFAQHKTNSIRKLGVFCIMNILLINFVVNFLFIFVFKVDPLKSKASLKTFESSWWFDLHKNNKSFYPRCLQHRALFWILEIRKKDKNFFVAKKWHFYEAIHISIASADVPRHQFFSSIDGFSIYKNFSS